MENMSLDEIVDFMSSLNVITLQVVRGSSQITLQDEDWDWKADLLMIQTQVMSGEAPVTNCINVTRDRIMECAKRGMNRRCFDPLKRINVVFVDDANVGEGAVDNGGPTREFLRLLLRRALHSYAFEGPLDSRHLALSTQALGNNMYRDIGKFIALSLIHGGPGPRCFSRVLYQTVAGQEVCCSVTDICDGAVSDKFQQIQAAASVEAAREEIQKNEDFLGMLGSLRYVRTLEERDELVQHAVDYYCLGRLQLALEQLMEGLSTGGILQLIQDHPTSVEHLFVKGTDKLTSIDIQDLFVPVLSEAGSNKRKTEDCIISYWRDWLIEVAVGECQTELSEILAFATGAGEVPPLGFTKTPSLDIAHDGGMFPTADVCAFVLHLPVHPSYEEWVQKMESGIIQSPAFGMA